LSKNAAQGAGRRRASAAPPGSDGSLTAVGKQNHGAQNHEKQMRACSSSFGTHDFVSRMQITFGILLN
jgi:hypothetical protein